MLLKNSNILKAYSCLKALNNGINENRAGKYKVYKATSKMKDEGEFTSKEEIELNKKYFEKEVYPGRWDGLKKGMSLEDYQKERDEFYDSEKEIEIYKIKLSEIENAKIITIFGKEASWPGEYFEALEPWLEIDINYEREDKVREQISETD